MAGIFNNLAQYNSYRDTMTGRVPMAGHGASWGGSSSSNPTPSRSWELVKEFKGKSHKDGGIDIEIGEGYVRHLNGKGIQPDDIAKNGRVWKNIGAGAYGFGEGVLDTVTMGATDQLTDAGYNALQKAGGSSEDEMREQNSVRGYSTAAGAIGTAVFTGGATTGTAIQQSAKGIGAGVSAGSPDSKFAQQVGTYLPMAGSIAGMAVGNAGFSGGVKEAQAAAGAATKAGDALKASNNTAGAAAKASEAAKYTAKADRLAAMGNVASTANKYNKYMPYAAQGLNMAADTGKSVIPEMGRQLSIPQNINAGLETIQMMNRMRKGYGKGATNSMQPQAPQNTPVAPEPQTTYSAQPVEQTFQDMGGSISPSQYQFLNDLRTYGINV